MTEKRTLDVQKVFRVSQQILLSMKMLDSEEDIAVAALGIAFAEKHFETGGNLAEFEEICMEIAEIFNRAGKK